MKHATKMKLIRDSCIKIYQTKSEGSQRARFSGGGFIIRLGHIIKMLGISSYEPVYSNVSTIILNSNSPEPAKAPAT